MRRLVPVAAVCALGLVPASGADAAIKKYLYRVEISSTPVETWSSMGVTGRAEATWTGIWWVPVRANTTKRTNTFRFDTPAKAAESVDRGGVASTFAGTASGSITYTDGTCSWSIRAPEAFRALSLRIYTSRHGLDLRLLLHDTQQPQQSCEAGGETTKRVFYSPEATFLNADFCAYNEGDGDRNDDYALPIPKSKVGKYAKTFTANERGVACNPFATEDAGTALTSELSLKAQIFKRRP